MLGRSSWLASGLAEKGLRFKGFVLTGVCLNSLNGSTERSRGGGVRGAPGSDGG